MASVGSNEPSYNRQQIFAVFKGDTRTSPLIQDETFGLYIEHITGKVSPFNIEETLESYFNVKSMSQVTTKNLVVLYGNYLKWKEQNGNNSY